MACPTNSLRYNSSLCACIPGYIFNGTANNCTLFTADSTIFTDGGIEHSTFSFPETILSFDSIEKLIQSQAVFLGVTLVMLLSWLGFCLFMRFMKVGDGRNVWFQIRWWISRLDITFATRHWLDDQKVVVKRKTELGGTFSIATWILFIGLFAVSLYHIISKRSIEVHNVRATNAPDLASFINEIEFNITTVSSMSCLNLRGLDSVVTGNPGFIDHRVAPLSNFFNSSCHNTSKGPTVSLQCHKCRLTQDDVYISWQFVDLPNNPATAVGFEFNLTSMNPANKKHLSFVSGTLKNGSTFDDIPVVTFRGVESNILKFNFFPQIYHNIHDLRLIQPLLHEFIPGSSFHETNLLQASLESSTSGLINTTLYINFLSTYIVEIDNKSIMGLVSFLADLGGLYCFSIGIFFFFLVQCEYRIKRLRTEDSVLRKVRNRRKAQENWDKLRKYVMYTWGCSILNNDNNTTAMGSSCSFMTHSVNRNRSHRGSGLLHKRSQQKRQDSISFNKKVSLPIEKNKFPECASTQRVKTCAAGMTTNPEEKSRNEPLRHEVIGSTCDGKQNLVPSREKDSSLPQKFSLTAEDVIPPPPSLEVKAGSEMDIYDIQKNFQSLYEYNAMLREKLEVTHSLLHALAKKSSSSGRLDHT